MNTAHKSALTLATMLIMATLTTTLMSGCIKSLVSNTPGGNFRSTDSFTYISTPFEPLTVTLYDQRDNEPLWTVDVPVGQKVTVRFLSGKAKEGTTRRPDIMQWEIYDQTKRRANLTNTMAVPGADSRLLKVALRDGVEYPDEELDDVQYDDPTKEWVPIEPRRFRGVPVTNTSNNARRGTYSSGD
ncbi:MAG: hypothetical protein JKX70_04185 [Phycisphaerales bacterium]|nr:hypothetical protein [Phycisphaerales bacterium]